jgi:hypothetical protein
MPLYHSSLVVNRQKMHCRPEYLSLYAGQLPERPLEHKHGKDGDPSHQMSPQPSRRSKRIIRALGITVSITCSMSGTEPSAKLQLCAFMPHSALQQGDHKSESRLR